MIVMEDRLSDSPYIERVWRSYSEYDGMFTSIAANEYDLVIEKLQGKIRMVLHGPEREATSAYCPPEGEWVGVILKFGVYMPNFPASNLMTSPVILPEATSQSFWLNGSAWEFPTFENADTFINRLAREGILQREPVVNDVLQGKPNLLSQRSEQRRFLRATGMNYTDARQIERARYATVLLRQGMSILDTVYEAGYFDQPHLTRSMKRFIGQTPAQIIEQNPQLSLLYDTVSSYPAMIETLDIQPVLTTLAQGKWYAQSRIADDEHPRRQIG